MPYIRVRLTAHGGPECLALEAVPELPQPGPGEVRVRVLVTSAAFTDVMIRKSMYPDVKEKPPFTPGYDMVGVVDAIGAGSKRFRPGDRVADLTTTGAYSQWICLPEERLTLVPPGVSDVDALGMVLSAVTPWQMLHRVAKMRPGQSLLIHGAGGAVGTTMLQLARDGGMLVAFGFQNRVLGRGGSIPLDFVKLTLWDWLPNGHATAFYSIGAMRRKHPHWFSEDLGKLLEMLAHGRIAPVVAEVLPLAQVRRAHERIEAGDVAGKLVLPVGVP